MFDFATILTCYVDSIIVLYVLTPSDGIIICVVYSQILLESLDEIRARKMVV